MIKKTVCCAVIFVGYCLARPLEFIDPNFDDFAHRVIKDSDMQKEFKQFYTIVSKKIQETDQTKKRATFRYLYNLALNRLEEKYPLWYEEIKPIISDPKFVLDEHLDEVRAMVRFFLTRYGVYEEFLLEKNKQNEKIAPMVVHEESQESPTLWRSFKSCMSSAGSYICSAGNTVAGWFGFGSRA